MCSIAFAFSNARLNSSAVWTCRLPTRSPDTRVAKCLNEARALREAEEQAAAAIAAAAVAQIPQTPTGGDTNSQNNGAVDVAGRTKIEMPPGRGSRLSGHAATAAQSRVKLFFSFATVKGRGGEQE